MTDHAGPFLSGVIEGFYGKPWTASERSTLVDWMSRWGLNTYFYAPKDDLHHRALWRENYQDSGAVELAQMIAACRERQIRFVYALSPGLDIRYHDQAEVDRIRARFEQMMTMGCEDFSLLFDDIPGELDPIDLQRWGSLAPAQCHVANAVFTWIRGRIPHARFVSCPTAYCGRMAARKLGGENYLDTIGRSLLPEIDVFWTGPDIVSRQITVEHIQELHRLLNRKPLIWDNLNANDYDGRRFFCGPYTGRPPQLRDMVSGLLSNPNNEFPLNYVPLRSLAEFTRGTGEWEARQSYLAGVGEWLATFATVTVPIPLEDLILFCDCFYLPHEDGAGAEAFYRRAERLVTGATPAAIDDVAAFEAHVARLREVCDRITELRYRPMFHALYRRIWDLREQLDLIERYVAFRTGQGPATASTNSFPLPAVKHPGLVARLRQLVVEHAAKAP